MALEQAYAEGDYEGARAHFENPLRIQEKSLGPDHPEVAIALGLYGVLLRRAGDPDGARRSYERALAILEAAVGPDDMDAARTRSYLGYLEYSLGNYDDARRHTLRALEEYRRIFSSGHRALAGPLYNLACLSALEGERDQALEFLREAVACGYAERGLLDDPDFAALRGDTEFEAIVSEVRQRWE